MKYDTNTAYDFNKTRSNAAPKRNEQIVKKAKIKTLPVKQHKKAPAFSLGLKIMICIGVLFMVSFNIYTRAEISDTQKQINNAQSDIDKLHSQQTKLEMEMENIISYQNLEQEAEKLGMHKKIKSQIHYIDTSDGERAEVVNDNK